MTISVVVPVYNEEQYIAKCLTSIKNQVDQPDEIIVVDNNCKDKTIEIAKKYNVRIVKEKKQGMTYARNKGFDTAKGDIIARCDADTIVPYDWIRKIKLNFRNQYIDALTGLCIIYDLPIKTTIYSKLYLDAMKVLQIGKNTLVGFNMAITKETWMRVRSKVCLDDKKVHEDIDLALKIIDEGGEIKVDKTLVVNTSGRRILKNPKSFFGEYPIRFAKTLIAHRLKKVNHSP